MQDRSLRRTNQSTALHDPEADEDDHPFDPGERYDPVSDSLPPEAGEYDPAPKATATFAVASKIDRRRISRSELARRRALFDLKAEIKAALGEKPNDGIKIGRLLDRAKGLVPHGGFEQFVTSDLELSVRTSQNYMARAKTAQPVRENANF